MRTIFGRNRSWPHWRRLGGSPASSPTAGRQSHFQPSPPRDRSCASALTRTATGRLHRPGCAGGISSTQTAGHQFHWLRSSYIRYRRTGLFKTWRGHRYGADVNVVGGSRVLVVGESHYSQKPEEVGASPENFTVDIVRQFYMEPQYNLTFGQIASVICDAPLSDWRDSMPNAFSSIAFFNYVPEIVSRHGEEGAARRRPTASAFAAGADALWPRVWEQEPSRSGLRAPDLGTSLGKHRMPCWVR